MRKLLTPHALLTTACLGVWLYLTPGPTHAQQMADPDFDASIAEPAYTETHPKVLFDEGHANFHTADGRYKPFGDLIRNDGYHLTANKYPFAKEVLDQFDILVIANASPPVQDRTGSAFTEDECDVVYDWVREGGALLLIADHAPYGGAAELLGKRFGVEMSKGYTLDEANSEKSGNAGWLIFSRDNQLLGDHAVTNGRANGERVTRVISFTGQSLKGPEGSVPFLALGDSAVDRLPPGFQETQSAAGRAQGVAFECGQGRVIVLGEAAMLSAQVVRGRDIRIGMNFPETDNRQLALNMMHWLSGLME